MCRFSAPPTAAGSTRSARSVHEKSLRFIEVPLSKSNYERHVRAPERQLFRTDTVRRILTSTDAAEMPHVPVHADMVAEKSRDASSEIERCKSGLNDQRALNNA